MESGSDGESNLQRTPSVASTVSHRSGTVRIRPRQHSSAAAPSTATTPKSLTSFPSLSPEHSPQNATARKGRASNAAAAAEATTPGQKKATKTKTKPSIVEALTTNSPSFRGRSALFEDSPTSTAQKVPGALHHASDEHIKGLLARKGAVTLVRQLAEDLAQRDAEITTLRRRADARERELKKMLTEGEVSHQMIEKRLHHLDYTAGIGIDMPLHHGEADKGKRPRPASGIDRMVGEAMADELEGSGFDETDVNGLAEQDLHATIRASSRGHMPDVHVRSTSSSSEAKAAAKGWKDYLWNGTARRTNRNSGASSIMSEHEQATDDETRPRVSSGLGTRRQGIDDTLFEAPASAVAVDGGDFSRDGSIADSKSDKGRPSSISSWTLKLFAGNTASTRDGDEASPARHAEPNGAVRNAKSFLNPERDANPSAKEALLKVSGKTVSKQKRRSLHQPLNVGGAAMVKSSNHSIHSLQPGSPASFDSGTQLGPVEMDTILPHGTRPPTLTPSYHNLDDATDYLTDRFGFIYDQRRKRKEIETFARLNAGGGAGSGAGSKEMLSSSKESDVAFSHRPPRSITPTSIDEHGDEQSTKRWQDYLKIATFPTELLSHTPSSAKIMTLTNAAMRKSLVRSPTFGDGGFEVPASTPNPLPLASSVTAGNAELAKPFDDVAPTARRASGDVEPVKLLLAQLTDLHDSLQREKTVRWNEFLRKVRAERRKAGEMAAASEARVKVVGMPETSLADGEVIGIATLGRKGKIGRAKYKEFKALVLGGIPVAHRAKIWAECSGASALRIPGYYEDLVTNGVDDPTILSQIHMDINRTLTDNVFFRKGPGVAKLNEVLLAYARRNAEVGYCQGMNLITASLLLIMPTAEDAFWVLVSIVEHMLPRHYFDNSLLTSRADQQVLRQYVADLLPRLSAHLDELGIELEALTFQWFLSLFTDCLSAEALYRVWDVLLCCTDDDGHGGATFLFQVALALLQLNESQLVACDSPAAVYAYLGGEITNHAISIDGLIRASDALRLLVRRADVEERRAKWVAVERETMRERARIRSEVGGLADGRTET